MPLIATYHAYCGELKPIPPHCFSDIKCTDIRVASTQRKQDNKNNVMFTHTKTNAWKLQ